MTVSARLFARHAYLDTNVLIAALERRNAGGQSLLAMVALGEVLATTSELTYAEAMVRPLGQRDHALIGTYQALLSWRSAPPGGGMDGAPSQVALFPITREVLHLASTLAARKIAMTDAIHVATAIVAKCDVFISNDRRIGLPSEIEMMTLDDIDVCPVSPQART